jgi:hypothetical protein
MLVRMPAASWQTCTKALAVVAALSCAARADDAIEPATATAPADAAAPAVLFTATETKVGDRVVQRVGMEFDLKSRIIQSGQIANESTSLLRRQQQRTIDVLEVAEGRTVRARASFEVARRQSPENPDASALVPLAIEGKAYFMIRKGEDVAVTDLEGRIPPLEECKLAVASLDSVGRPNPLALVLAGRRVALGQSLFVPKDMARTLLGMNAPEFTDVHRFELTLVRLAPAADNGGQEQAIFRAAIEVRPKDDAMAMSVAGEFAIEPTTCRLAAIDLAGPVQMTSIERTPLGFYQNAITGKLRLAIRSQYGQAAK